MKNKILVFTILLVMFLFPFSVLGAVDYLRTPSGYTISNPVSFSVSADNYEELKSLCYDNDFAFWGVLTRDLEFNPFYSDLVASSTLSDIFEMTLNFRKYLEVEFVCYNEAQGQIGDYKLEQNGVEGIFEVVESPPYEGDFITITTSSVASTTAYIGDLIGSISGLLWLIIGVPLGFVVIKKAMLFIPK